MHISFDPRAVEAKAQAACALIPRKPSRSPRLIHSTGFAALVAGAFGAGMLVGVILIAAGA